jgi:hypothetical protein
MREPQASEASLLTIIAKELGGGWPARYAWSKEMSMTLFPLFEDTF